MRSAGSFRRRQAGNQGVSGFLFISLSGNLDIDDTNYGTKLGHKKKYMFTERRLDEKEICAV